MQRFTANTVLHDRMLLKEELSFDAQQGQQVWTVQDQQTGQSLIARFHHDGRVEWFSDNRPPVITAPSAVARPQPPPAPPAVPPQPLAGKPTSAVPNQRVVPFLTVMLVLSLVIAGYFYRKPLMAAAQSLRPVPRPDAGEQAGPDSPNSALHAEADPGLPGTRVNQSRRQPAVSFRSDLGPTGEPTGNTANSTPTSVGKSAKSAISAPQATRLLNLMKQIPAGKHPAIFADARQAFTQLRQMAGQQAHIDSLYTVCMNRGAQSLATYRQNGDPVSRRYAAEWYQTACALKPNPAVEYQINALRSNEPKPRPKSIRKPTKTNAPLFMSDPEVNR